jgi:Dolichyl-phosphate-mannose-protein mannosyltransferase
VALYANPGVDTTAALAVPVVEPAAQRPAPSPGDSRRSGAWRRVAPRAALAAILAVGALLRSWEINAVGLNSDEAVYAGQGASIAGDESLAPYFPTFRAHPLLFQTLVSIGFRIDSPELFGRLAAAALGVATVFLTYLLGKSLYGRRAGLVAALLMSLMPYHVVVTRQILLDGPMVFCSTLALYMLAKYGLTQRHRWLYAGAAALGLTFLAKESSVILLGSVYAFLALTPELRTRIHHLIGCGILFAAIVSAFPLSLAAAGASKTGGNFVAWQLFRRPNHDWMFYPTVVPLAIGLGVVGAAALGLWLLRRSASWRETLLLSWMAVPIGFFQLFPVKGFQYLLPIAPAVAVLAARFLVHWGPRELPRTSRLGALRRAWLMPFVCALIAVSLVIPSWQRVQPPQGTTFLAGSGGIPGGREAGLWIAANVPVGARMMSVGPSMANILQYYGRRKIYGLSVSPNPLHRNPVYEAMKNPDRLIRDNELQYVVWDAFSADRSPFFSRKLMRYVERYNGRVIHSETVPVETSDGHVARKPVITIYEVRP